MGERKLTYYEQKLEAFSLINKMLDNNMDERDIKMAIFTRYGWGDLSIDRLYNKAIEWRPPKK